MTKVNVAPALIALTAIFHPATAAEPATGAQPAIQPVQEPWDLPEPGLSYGKSDRLVLPRTILFSASPDEIIADAEEWARRGVNAFFLDYVARDPSTDIWASDGEPWTIGESDKTFQKAQEANAICRKIGSQTFLKIAFDHPFEWFNDIAWQKLNDNFRQFAVFARETGCTGIALDIEYVGEQYSFNWKGYTYDGYSREDLVLKIRRRMTNVIGILYDEFPDMVFLTFPETGLSLGTAIHAAWIEEAARRNAPGGIHYCTESTYRRPNIRYIFGHAWARNELFSRLLTPKAGEYWRTKCSVAVGIWPFGFDYQNVYAPGLSVEQFRQAFAASLMVSPRYNWIYSHNCRELLIGRSLEKYTGQEDVQKYLDIIANKEIVTASKYLSLAEELRAMVGRDYSTDLGLSPALATVGPEDTVREWLEPVQPAATAKDQSLAKAERERLWRVGIRQYEGKSVNLHQEFQTQTQWMLIGPFPNDENWSGHSAVYPPETEINLKAEFDGIPGKVHWTQYKPSGNALSVDLTGVFSPTERVCAYALCYVSTPQDTQCQIRLGTNDSGKL